MSATAFVERRGRAFEFGDHVDGKGRKFSLTAAQFAVANPPGTRVNIGFDPVKGAHYYTESHFDGKLGEAHSFDPKGRELLAEFSLHPLLDEVIFEKGLKMSAIFGVPSNKLLRIDVVDPDKAVINGAVFFAREGDGDAEEVAIPVDDAVFAVALPAAGAADRAVMQMAMQHMHDVCASAYPSMCSPTVMFAMHEGPRKHMALIHKMTMTHGASCSGGGKSRFAVEEDEMADDIATEEIDQAEFAQMKADLAALRKRDEQREAQLKAERDRRIQTESAAFARDNAALLPPPSQPLFAGLFAALSDLPEDVGVVEFAYGKEQKFKGSPLDLLKGAVASLKPHGLGIEKIINDSKRPALKPGPIEGVVVFSADETEPADPAMPTPEGQPMSAERRAFLMGQASGTPAKPGKVSEPMVNGSPAN